MNKDKWKSSAYLAFIKFARKEKRPFTVEQIRIKIGELNSRRRQAGMESDDPDIRRAAIGNLGVLSGIKQNNRIKKPSQM